MDFYNPTRNVPDDWSCDEAEDYTEEVATYHFTKAREAIATINKRDPELGKAVADAIMHSILAANVHNHDLFVRRYDEDADFATRMRKNY